jgi:hypothetical protein
MVINQKENRSEISQEDIVVNLERACKEYELELNKMVKKLSDINFEKQEAVHIMDNLLKIIPAIRKIKSRLRLERAVKKYGDILAEKGINRALLNYIIQQKRNDLSKQSYELDNDTINKKEKSLGISEEDSNVFEKFRLILPESKDLDDIEVIVRAVRLKLAHSENKELLNKDRLVKYFVDEAGFDERSAVSELLLNKTLADAIKTKVVTEERLIKELTKIKGDFTVLSKKIIEIVNKKISKINESMGKETPLFLRFFSNYFVNPIAGTASVVGIVSLVLYTFGRYASEALRLYLPKFIGMFDAMGITVIANELKPQPVYLFCFILIFIGGLLKMIDENIKKKIIKRKVSAQ